MTGSLSRPKFQPRPQGFNHGKRAVVVPLSETETVRRGTDVIITHDGLAVLADSLIAFVEGRELYGKPDPG